MEYFEFVGISEYYEEDLLYFSKNYLSGSLKHKRLNSANNQTTKISIDTALLEKIASYHEEDIKLYQRALKLRRSRRFSGQSVDDR